MSKKTSINVGNFLSGRSKFLSGKGGFVGKNITIKPNVIKFTPIGEGYLTYKFRPPGKTELVEGRAKVKRLKFYGGGLGSPSEEKEPNISEPTYVKNKYQFLSLLDSFKFALPSRYREEFSGDITEMFSEMESEGHSKIWIYVFLLLNVSSVCWVSFRFKWNEYFESARRAEKGE